MGLVSSRKIYADQVEIDTPLVRELVAVQFPQWAAKPLEPIDSGGLVNAIYRLGSDLSVRLPLRPAITDMVQREQAKLAALAPYLSMAIPAVEAIGAPTDAYPGEWSVHRWLTGTTPSPASSLIHADWRWTSPRSSTSSGGSTFRTGRRRTRASAVHALR